MNLKEGTRRLALLLGVAGAICGSFASYLELQTILEQRARHSNFERYANSDVVRQEKGEPDWSVRNAQAPGEKWNPVPELRAKYPGLKEWSDERILESLSDPAKFRSAFPQYAALSDDVIKRNIAVLRAKATMDSSPANGPWEVVATEVDADGIKIINWNKSHGVESIETEDGGTLYPTPAPSRWLYLFAAILPLLGFALPWGLIRAVGWVGAGFLASTK